MRYPSFSLPSSFVPTPVSLSHSETRNIVERALRQIILACEDACAAKLIAPQGSAEWCKRTGEILAYGKVTSMLCRLQTAIPPQELH